MNKLELLRTQSNMSREELAAKVSTTGTSIYRAERRGTKPRTKTITALEALFGTEFTFNDFKKNH